MTTAIILAGGLSERLSNFGKPKQFTEVGGKLLISYALNTFEACATIDGIAIVAPQQWHKYIITGGKFLCFAEPGQSRQESIANGLRAIQHADKVVIHDAARPLVTIQDVTECVNAVDDYDGATPYLQVTDTVYQSNDGVIISGLLNRDMLYAGQTPECYEYSKYLKAHEGVDLSTVRGSSELAFSAGMRIHLYPGNKRNLKITTLEDLEYFRYLQEHGL